MRCVIEFSVTIRKAHYTHLSRAKSARHSKHSALPKAPMLFSAAILADQATFEAPGRQHFSLISSWSRQDHCEC
jgi:hypothetical protein